MTRLPYAIKELIDIINSIQTVKEYSKDGDILYINFESELFGYSFDLIQNNIDLYEECHKYIDKSVSLENHKTISLKFVK